jgi:hypothetical protein
MATFQYVDVTDTIRKLLQNDQLKATLAEPFNIQIIYRDEVFSVTARREVPDMYGSKFKSFPEIRGEIRSKIDLINATEDKYKEFVNYIGELTRYVNE